MSSSSITPPTGMVVTGRFLGIDDFQESAAQWNLDFRQLDRGRLDAYLAHIITPCVIISQCKIDRKMDQYGQSPPGYQTIAIPANRSFKIRWKGQEVGPDNVMYFADRELDAVSAAGFAVFTVSISDQCLADAAMRRGLESVEELLPKRDLTALPRDVMSVIRQRCEFLATSVVREVGLLSNHGFRSTLEEEFVDQLLDTLSFASPQGGRLRISVRRIRALKKALDFIEATSDEAMGVAELERQVGVSGRTLRYAFEEEFGLSPKQYMMTYRLNNVRSQIFRMDPRSETISDVANEWGFWHMGQFAKDYRKMFGELPSETAADYADYRPPGALMTGM